MTISCEIMRTPAQMATLKAEWQELSEKMEEDQDFYLTWDWYYSVVYFSRSLPGELRIFVARREKELLALIPCLLVKKKLRFFSVRSLELLGNIYSPRRGALVLPGQETEIAAWFVQFLLTEFRIEWDLLDFFDLSPKDLFIAALIEKAKEARLWLQLEDLFANVVTGPEAMHSSAGFHASLSKNMRGNINNCINKHNRNGVFDLWLFQNISPDCETAITSYHKIYSNSWKTKEEHPDFHDKLSRYLAEQRKLRLFFLCYRPKVDEDQDKADPLIPSWEVGAFTVCDKPPSGFEPIAAMYCLVHKQQAYSLKLAYNENFFAFSPGLVLFWFAVKHLIEVDRCTLLDHQKGDEAYKLGWNGKVRETRFCLRFANPRAFLARVELRTTFFLKRVKKLLKKN